MNDQTNILIVDDLREKLLVYTSMLEDLGQTLVAVQSGEAALKEVLRTDFAVILLDVNMPGMDGLETARLIRGRRGSAHVPIIFLTAYADEVRTAEGYAHGAVDYITTPVVPEILRAKVRVFVELYQMRQQVVQQAGEQAKRQVAEDSARMAAFLADASRTLGSSLDPRATLRSLARLAVPFLGEVGFATLSDGRGGLVETEWAWTCGRDRVETCAGPGLGVLDAALAPAVERVLASGSAASFRSQLPEIGLRDDPPDGEIASIEGVSTLPVMVERNALSGLVFPLAARGRILGAFGLARGVSGRLLELSDIAAAEDLAGRAGAALDNALLLQDIQDQDRRKSEFLSMLAHELRNPLAPIRNAIEILKRRGPDQPELSWAREVVDRQVTQLTRLVDDLLDVSRITSGKVRLDRALLEVRAVVARAVETSRPLVEQHGHYLAVSVAAEPMFVMADAARLEQVLSNLLNNAAKYTPDGGRIDLTVERSGDDVVFRVRDTGAGISAEMLDHVFELFTQVDRSLDRSQGGLGIGLTLVRTLVELHEGTVRAASEGPGRGSEFVVRLPARPGAAQPSEERRAHRVRDPSTAGGARILVVDDNVDAANSLAMLLESSGHEVRSVHDGPNALVTAEQFRPEIVLLDIGLPGLDGYEVARRLRLDPANKRMLLVAVSGYGQEKDRQRSRQSGFDHHLTKPVDLGTLDELLLSPRARGLDADGHDDAGHADQARC